MCICEYTGLLCRRHACTLLYRNCQSTAQQQAPTHMANLLFEFCNNFCTFIVSNFLCLSLNYLKRLRLSSYFSKKNFEMWLAITYPKNFEMWPFCLLFVFQKCGRLTRRYLSKKIEMWKSCLLPNSAQIWAIDPPD